MATTPGDERDEWLEVESRIRGLDGVVAVTLLTDELGEPSEVQVFTAPTVDTGRLREEIAHILRVELPGPQIELAVLALSADVREEPAVLATERRARIADDIAQRVEIRRVLAASVKDRSAVQVILGHRGRQASGFARDGMGRRGVELAARATVDAVESLLGRPGWLQLLGAVVGQEFGRSTITVLVSTNGPEASELMGATVSGELPFHEAAVRATLDAINRQVALHLPDQERA